MSESEIETPVVATPVIVEAPAPVIPTPTPTPTVEAGPELYFAVKTQIEYYFSKENLSSDVFLASQMDANFSVLMSVIMNFPKVKLLTSDEGVLRKALEDSTVVTIVDNRLKANLKPLGRNTIILREIPSESPEEEVKEIFNYDGCKQISSIRSEIGDTWFVAMDNEEAAKDTVLDLRMKKRTFRGKPVKAGLKTETVVKSFYPVQNTPAQVPLFPIPGLPMYGGMMPGMNMYGYGGMNSSHMNGMNNGIPGMNGGMNGQHHAMNGHGMNNGMPSMHKAFNQFTLDPNAVVPPSMVNPDGTLIVQKKDTPSDNTSNTQAYSSSSANEDGVNGGGNGASIANKGKANKGTVGGHQSNGVSMGAGSDKSRTNQGVNSRQKGQQKFKKDPEPTIEINMDSFPPLQTPEDTPIPEPGYKDTVYLKYGWEEVIAIVKTVNEKDCKQAVPSNFAAGHTLAMQENVNKDLLHRQRTFSIDETREQLNQGRPVHKEAVISGSKVDMRSLAYGDEQHAPTATSATGVTSASGSTSTSTGVSKAVEGTVGQGGKTVVRPQTPPTMAKQLQKNGASGSAPTIGKTVGTMTGSNTESSAPVSDGIPSPGERKTISQSTWAAICLKTSTVVTSSSTQTASGPSTRMSAKVVDSPKRVGAKDGNSSRANSGGVKDGRGASSGGGMGGNGGVGGKSDKEKDRRKGDVKAIGVSVPAVKKEKEEGETSQQVDPVAPTTWGGKASFANILKTSVEGTTTSSSSSTPLVDLSAPTTTPTASHTTNTTTGLTTGDKGDKGDKGDRGDKTSSTGSAGGAVAGTSGVAVLSSNSNSAARNAASHGNRSTSVSTDASGLWAKASLPSL